MSQKEVNAYKILIKFLANFVWHFCEFNDQAKTAQEILQKAGTVSMEYLNIFKTKFANTVVDTVYMAECITKTVLPGNPVTREYEVDALFIQF